MADILGIGTSGLIAYQNTLNTISHNISNSTTEGYSRQRTDMATRPPQGTGIGFFGSGVQVTAVDRVVDEFLIGQIRTQTSRNSELAGYYDLASRIDNLLSDPEAGITPTLQEFFDSVQAVADSPGSIPAREVMLTSGELVVERMQYVHESIASINDAIKLDVQNAVGEINKYAASIADINEQIVLQSQKFGHPPNDMLDQRDELLRKLSEHINISTLEQDDGAVNVFMGTGQPLVTNYSSFTLEMVESDYDPTEFELELGNGNGVGVNVTDLITGGSLGGTLSFKQEILDPSLNQLGRVAVGLATTFNAQHAEGMTLNDELGGNFFNDFTTSGVVEVYDNGTNTGSGVVTADIVDASQLTADDYVLRYDGGNNYSVLRQPNNTVATTFSGAVPISSQFEGVQFNVTTVPDAGDTFLVRPTRTAARNIDMAIDDASDIAAAGAVRGYANTSNLGDATISAGELITDTTDPDYVTPAVFNTVTPVTIDFRTSGGGTAPYADEYSLDGGTTWNAYTSGADISLNGMRVQISGTPFDGDEFTMERNTGATSDNRNALALGQLQTSATLGDKGTGAGPTLDYQSAYGQLVAMVGNKTHQADISRGAQEKVLEQAVAARDRISGVNLDEEAANLIKFQQAYQATARVVTTAQTMFQTLLDSVR